MADLVGNTLNNLLEIKMENTDQDLTMDELATLKARADMLGITYHPSIGVEKLKEKISAVTSNQPKEPETVVGDVKNDPKADALRLIRIRLQCMNPAKKEWEGEIISVGNSVVGTVKKYIPFNADEGWHVPKMLFDYLNDKQCQVFVTVKDSRGNSIRRGKLIKEFSIEVLPPLTADELKEMARRQALGRNVD